MEVSSTYLPGFGSCETRLCHDQKGIEDCVNCCKRWHSLVDFLWCFVFLFVFLSLLFSNFCIKGTLKAIQTFQTLIFVLFTQ